MNPALTEEIEKLYGLYYYKFYDCGGFVIEIPGYEQPMEMFLVKSI